MLRRFFPMAIALLLLSAHVASAQYVTTSQSGIPYPALTSATPIALTGLAGSPANDVGRAVIPIGFSFPFYDRSYSSLTVFANGFVALEPVSNAAADFNANLTLPNSTQPNGVIAPLWDDLNGNNPASVVQRQAVSGSNGQGIAIEWKDWNRALSTYSLTFQLRLWENGLIDFYYGPMTGMGQAITATIGIESPLGTSGTPAFMCPSSNQCSLASMGSTTFVRFGPPVGIDLQANRLSIDSVSENADAGTLTVSTRLNLRNFGTLPSGNFTYSLYLSDDTILDFNDAPFAPAMQGPVTLNALEVSSAIATSTVAKPASGSFYVLAMIDEPNAVGETNETNNLIASSVPLSAGVDLVAESIEGPALAGPGDAVSVHAVFSNQGLDSAGAVSMKLYASVDAVLSNDDVLLDTESVTVLGGQSVQTGLTFTMPGTLRTNDYFLLLQLDDGPDVGAIVESSDGNNVVASTRRTTVQQADLVLDYVRVAQPLPPYDSIPWAFLGEPVRLEAVVRNQGGANATDAGVAFYLSDNQTLNGLTDTFVAEVNNLTIPAQGEQFVTVTANLPLVGSTQVPLVQGPYFFFGAAIAPGVTELNTRNNFAQVGPVIVKSPAPDLVPLQVRGPIRLAAGELFPVTRSFANQGDRPATSAKYRYFLSANEIITADDIPLQIQTPTGLVSDRSVTLGVGAIDYGSDFVQLPTDVPAAQYFIGALIDEDNQVVEADEANNGLAGQPVLVTAVPLRLVSNYLHDAVLGRPWSSTFAATGNTGPVTYTLAAGSQLPPGLTLTPQGALTGTPTTGGIFSFTLVISADGRSVEASLSLRVLKTSTSLSISTVQLPAPAKALAYDAQLGVQGGQKPYTWSQVGGELPAGIVLSSTGHLTGIPTSPLGSVFTFELRVIDLAGNSDRRTFTCTVVEGEPFLISTVTVPNAVVGTEYVADLGVQNASGTAVSRPVKWATLTGELPPGIAFETSFIERIILSGTPTLAGTYRFRVEATDALGRADSVNYLLIVEPSGLAIEGVMPEKVQRGTEVNVALTATPAMPGIRWFLHDGLLPPGLTLNADTGVISGTVADNAAFWGYTFTVAIGINETEFVGFRPFRIDVGDVEAAPVKKGCSTSGQGLAAWGLVLLVLMRRRARLISAP